MPPPAPSGLLGGGLDGFESPYLGHTGSWDGKGGALGGGSKAADMDKEVAMGLRWTFMPVHWKTLEPDGPVDLTQVVPAAWQELDAFVVAAQAQAEHPDAGPGGRRQCRRSARVGWPARSGKIRSAEHGRPARVCGQVGRALPAGRHLGTPARLGQPVRRPRLGTG